jgi:UDPglucose 6-dehydrogenase
VRIAVFGAGHVGLVTGACFAGVGHDVRLFDVDHGRIEALRGGRVPFVEPGLEEITVSAFADGRLRAEDDARIALDGAEVAFICVPTLTGSNGSADLSAVVAATHTLAKTADAGTVVVNRSTAPVGTLRYIRSLLLEHGRSDLLVAVNPEFLAEGSAVADFLVPDRVVIGGWDGAATSVVAAAYQPILAGVLPDTTPAFVRERASAVTAPPALLVSNPSTVELTKYAANAFLAVKVSFINEIASIAEELGADVGEIATAVGLDHRIGPHFLRAGLGWGGSCFPKDIRVLQGMAETSGVTPRILAAANEVNLDQRRWVIRKLRSHLRTLIGRRVALLGIAFKPNTDDLRSAPALEIAEQLASMNVAVRGYDPVVTDLPPANADSIELARSAIDAARGADAVILVTEWAEFGDLDLAELRGVMRTPLLLDGRNMFRPDAARAAGFTYVAVGRGEDDAIAPTAASRFVLVPDGDGDGEAIADGVAQASAEASV